VVHFDATIQEFCRALQLYITMLLSVDA